MTNRAKIMNEIAKENTSAANTKYEKKHNIYVEKLIYGKIAKMAKKGRFSLMVKVKKGYSKGLVKQLFESEGFTVTGWNTNTNRLNILWHS